MAPYRNLKNTDELSAVYSTSYTSHNTISIEIGLYYVSKGNDGPHIGSEVGPPAIHADSHQSMVALYTHQQRRQCFTLSRVRSPEARVREGDSYEV